MHKLVSREEGADREFEEAQAEQEKIDRVKEEIKAERARRKEAEKSGANKPDQAKTAGRSVFDLPLSYIISLLTNVFHALQLEINRIHIRYEDDYFNSHRPLSIGLAIEKI